MTQTPYLFRSRHDLYYFRFVVPEPLRPVIGQRELRRSLQTKDLRTALTRSGDLLAQVEQLVESIGQGKAPSALNCSWRPRRTHTHKCPRSHAAASSSFPTLTALYDEYAAHQRLEGVSEKTIGDKRAMVEAQVWIIGDKPVTAVGREEVKRFRETLLQLPPGFQRLRNQPLEKVIAGAERTLSVTTHNNYIKYLGTVFAYAVRQGYCTQNPFTHQKVRQRQKASAQRARYSHEELRILFGSDLYTKQHAGPAWRYWLPLLGLYTGARLNELCQLYLEDVVEVEGIDCLYIRAQHPDQKLKNLASERLIPIHSQLKALGLLEHVARLRAQGETRLFPELTLNSRNGYGHSAGKWFGRYRQRLGVGGVGKKTDFHSFRHTVADELKQQGIAESLIAALLGHQAGGITFGRYGKEFRPQTLVPVVEGLAFPT